MKNPKYREAMADLYRFVEDFEDTPPIGSDNQDEYWKRCAEKLEALIGKYADMREVQNWILGVYDGFDTVAKKKAKEALT